MYVVALFVVLAFWYVLNYIKWRRRILLPLEKIPGTKRYPFIGTAYVFFGVPHEQLFPYFCEYVKSMPPLFRLWQCGTPEVHFKKAEHLEMVMNNTVHITKGEFYTYLRPWLGDGLLMSTGEKWRKHRKLLTPTFHFKILENFMDTFTEKSKRLLAAIEKDSQEGFFDIFPYLTSCALDIICETAMGINSDTMKSNNSEYINSIKGLCNIIIWRATRPYIGDAIFYILSQGKRYKKYLTILHNFSDKVIAEKKQLLQQTKSSITNEYCEITKNKKLSFLDLLLNVSENGSVLSDKDIREEVDTFMFEGHDTVTASLSWSLFLLGNHPDVQEKVFLEVQEVLGEKITPSTIEELNEMKYLECVIKEALRLYPSVPVVSRIAVEDFYVDGYLIPKGTQLVLHIYQVHRDPKYYPEPEKFDPDRFLPENCDKRHPFSYLSFSAGPRNCIGQRFALYEEKTILASIIKNFCVRSRESQEEVNAYSDLILKSLKGVVVELKRRNANLSK